MPDFFEAMSSLVTRPEAERVADLQEKAAQVAACIDALRKRLAPTTPVPTAGWLARRRHRATYQAAVLAWNHYIPSTMDELFPIPKTAKKPTPRMPRYLCWAADRTHWMHETTTTMRQSAAQFWTLAKESTCLAQLRMGPTLSHIGPPALALRSSLLARRATADDWATSLPQLFVDIQTGLTKDWYQRWPEAERNDALDVIERQPSLRLVR